MTIRERLTIQERLERHLLSFLSDQLDTSGPRGLLAAVSGGLDSTALLHLLHATADRHQRGLVAGHVNHGVRADAAEDEDRLRGLCARLAVPFRCVRLRLEGSGPGGPSEETMRRARYRALEGIARSTDCGFILLAHQRDDQAETLLLNLIRGAGLQGLAGMAHRRGIFLRPLLSIPRSDLRRYLDEIGAAWRDDSTNLDLDHPRNRIRHHLLPLIESTLRPGATATIARTAGHLRRTLEAVEAEVRSCLAACSLPGPDGEIRLDAEHLRSYHPGWIEQAIRAAVARIRGSTREISASTWNQIVEVHRAGRDGQFLLSRGIGGAGGVRLELTGRVIRICKAAPENLDSAETEVPWSGSVRWSARARVRTRILSARGDATRLQIRGLSRAQAFDADAVQPPARIRLPRKGDRILLEDFTRSRKLFDLLSERGIPRSRRAEQPVLEDAQGVLWAPGIRRAGRALVSEQTRRIWIVRWFGRLPVDQAWIGGASRGQ